MSEVMIVMPDSNFIDARKFTFKPFPHPLHPEESGDSGMMEFAVSKTDPNEQYIIKRGDMFPEVACNEFIYHKVSSLLRLYTQDVKLISGNREYRRAAAIRFVPDAKLFSLDESSEENYRAYFEFEALFVILSENDSHEYYIENNGRLFKLDNAASFGVDTNTIRQFTGDPCIRYDTENAVNTVDYKAYSCAYQNFREIYGKVAADVYLSVFKRFAEFDEGMLYSAYGDLDKQYPKAIGYYYDKFICIRKNACDKFLNEMDRQ
jgi:hypothetical protein